MTDVIVYTNTNNSVCLVRVAPNYSANDVQVAVVPANTVSYIIDDSTLPSGPIETWSLDTNGNVTIDTNKQQAYALLQAPKVISDRQFFQQLAITPDPSSNTGATLISQSDAIAAVGTGTIPPAMMPLINALPANEQFSAEIELTGATQFEITNPFTIAIAKSYGWSNTDLQLFWLKASQL